MCHVTRSLSVVGDRWTLLILWMLSRDVHRFDQIQTNAGIAPNILTQRLRRMEQDGIVDRRPYQDRPRRFEYHATAKGRALNGVLLLLRDWGAEHGGA